MPRKFSGHFLLKNTTKGVLFENDLRFILHSEILFSQGVGP